MWLLESVIEIAHPIAGAASGDNDFNFRGMV
jgi:hypothetical protein